MKCNNPHMLFNKIVTITQGIISVQSNYGASTCSS